MTSITLPAPNARTVVRRLYFYGVALISFIAALVAFNLLVQTLAAVWLEGWLADAVVDFAYVRDTVAAGGGVLLVATPIFLLHWGYVQRREEEGERRSALRKFFLYGASLVAVGYAVFYSYELLFGLGLLALGEPALSTPILPSKWLADLLMVVAGVALQSYFHAVLVQDGDYGAEAGWAGGWRRLYQTLAGLVGLVLVIWGLSGILEMLVHMVLETNELSVSGGWWWRATISNGVAQAIVGALLVRTNWMRWRTLATSHPAEAQTALRRFYLYGSVVVGALATLIPAAVLLNEALLQLFELPGQAPQTSFWDAVATTVGLSPVGLVVWWWHWRYLQREADAYGESSQGATVRRLYYYAVATTGLILLWYGAGGIIQALLEGLLAQRAAGDRFWIYPLATGLSLLAVGAPIWAYHWRVVESIARREDRTGLEERASGPRKVYLYGVALAGALLILYYLARVVYRLLLVLLGEPATVLMSGETADEIARSAIAAVFWTVHVLAIRRDGQQGTEAPPVAQAADLETRRAALAARISRLEADLAAARAELAALEQAEPTAPQP